jgi:hypothetical protein
MVFGNWSNNMGARGPAAVHAVAPNDDGSISTTACNRKLTFRLDRAPKARPDMVTCKQCRKALRLT